VTCRQARSSLDSSAPATVELTILQRLEDVYWGGVIILAVIALTWLYHVAPGWYTPWRRDLPGALLALVVWLLASWVCVSTPQSSPASPPTKRFGGWPRPWSCSCGFT
jgi:uncharacterized BrkB/YihY/UPF0761 family membrane protein